MFTYIDTKENLSFLNQELLKKPFVGVDTEFRRTTKNNMKLALLQINDGDEIFLVDTLSIDDPKEDCDFLFSKSVLKILHSCKEDLEAIYSWANHEMSNIFDTQLANSFLQNDYSISYQDLVERMIGVSLEKKETRSNWLKRPLSGEQLKYAALDVEYLIYIYEQQIVELQNSNKLNWLNQDIDYLVRNAFNPHSFFTESKRTLSKAQENELLIRLNEIVEGIAEREKVNTTLFFSKKIQKEFLRLVLAEGLNFACGLITPWRRELVEEELLDLLK